jgi:hypothetical protein
MSETGNTRVTLKPGEAPPTGKTDWARLDAMTDAEVIAAALSDPDAQPLSPDAPARALLLAIERDPEVMRRLLADHAA